MIIKELKTDRFLFNNWVKDTRGHWNAVSRVIIANKFPILVMLTIQDTNSDKVNNNTRNLCDLILENLETVDAQGDDFRAEMLLESSGEDSIPLTLMFFTIPGG